MKRRKVYPTNSSDKPWLTRQITNKSEEIYEGAQDQALLQSFYAVRLFPQ